VLRRGISGSIRREHWWANYGGGGNRHERAAESGPQNPVVVVRWLRCGCSSDGGVLLERERWWRGEGDKTHTHRIK